ncbi:MAG: hypothetical protein COV99_10055 [Bacteroidetes bacterium CG12_big_fil_rev_8_21_14_0_65_60_17]|nr:MAG: hypothetical protein COV99_10055 [Bacteroidetes bacterium CG12_big_fil_rev_8_21_14_0_65_60_17]
MVYQHDLRSSTSYALNPELAHLLLDSRAASPLKPWEEALLDPRHRKTFRTEDIDSETLWLARAIYSETKRPEEQALVAWVIRNRVETGYRGKRSYQSVVLDPFQFSAFSPTSPKREHYMSLTPAHRVPGWNTALYIAHMVRHADSRHRPFSPRTRHFYSERSMTNAAVPEWAAGRDPVEPEVETIRVDDRRFRFFEGVS